MTKAELLREITELSETAREKTAAAATAIENRDRRIQEAIRFQEDGDIKLTKADIARAAGIEREHIYNIKNKDIPEEATT